MSRFDQALQSQPRPGIPVARACEQGGCQLASAHRRDEPFLLVGDPQLPYAVQTELHVLGEPLASTVEGKPALFVRCSCGLTFEVTFVATPVCPIAELDAEYVDTVERASMARRAAISNKRAIAKADEALLRGVA